MDIELFRKLLLAGLVLILIVILYKRLLSFLTGKQSNRKYSSFSGEGILRGDQGRFDIEINVPIQENVSLKVKDKDGNTVLVLADSELDSGEHSFGIEQGQLSLGRYSCELLSSNQKSVRYFNVR